MAERIYWTDLKLNVIGSSDFNGQGLRIVLREMNDQVRQPYSIAVFEVKPIFEANLAPIFSVIFR